MTETKRPANPDRDDRAGFLARLVMPPSAIRSSPPAPMPLSQHTLTHAWRSRGMLACLLWPASMLMAALVWLRRLAFRQRWLASIHLPVPTLVIGNRIVGGAGKTPTTIAVLTHLQHLGWRPAVLSRGYKAQPRIERPLLIDARTASGLTSVQTGDEPWLIWLRTRVPVMVGRDRVASGRALLAAHPEVNILVCDDGLQHLHLQRDIEVIVFDERGAGNGWLLPAGPLREPWNCPPTPGLVAPPVVLYNAQHPSTPLPGHLAHAHMSWPVRLDAWWQNKAGHAETEAAPARLQPTPSQSVWAMAGIAQPQRFFEALAHKGFDAKPLPLNDHADFSTLPWPAEVSTLIVTEKDAVKLPPSRTNKERPHTQIWVVGLDFKPDASFWQALDSALARLPAPDAVRHHHAAEQTRP